MSKSTFSQVIALIGFNLQTRLFASVKRAWGAEGVKRMVGCAGRSLQKSEFYTLYNATMEKAATRTNAIGGFLHTGLYPVDRQVSFFTSFTPFINKKLENNDM